jgi:hypothetical protein
MQLLAIGDIHGRDAWKVLPGSRADRIIFIGDYVDSRGGVGAAAMVQNFREIIEFRQQQPERVTLLLGNHDIQYLYHPLYACTGFRADLQPVYTQLFEENAELFQVAWQYKKYLFTHAGVSGKWYRRHEPLLEQQRQQQGTLADALNALQQREEHRPVLFEIGAIRGGSAPAGGPLWADKSETETDYLKGYHQVVGHSRVDSFERFGNGTSSITYIDVLSRRPEVYELTLP